MNDLFQHKAQDWDTRPAPVQISAGVGRALLERVALRDDMAVMDFGAGTGLICAQVAPHVRRVYAVDVSAAMLEQLAAKPELQGKVDTMQIDILATPFPHKVDLIVSAMAMHHVEDTGRLLQAFADHLAPGGKVALADLDSEDGSFHPPDTEGVYHHGFDRDGLRAQLEVHGFSDIDFTTAVEVDRDGKRYPVFLVTATRV
ncbi:MAG: class I SAM-dependent methyltransferase [Polyangiales bacterium]